LGPGAGQGVSRRNKTLAHVGILTTERPTVLTTLTRLGPDWVQHNKKQ